MILLFLVLLVFFWVFTALYDKKRMHRLSLLWYLGYLMMTCGRLVNIYFLLLMMLHDIEIEIPWRLILIPYFLGLILGSLARLLDSE